MPELSPQNRIDKAVVVDPDGASVGEVVEAAGNCPVSAIFVVGEEGDLYP